VTRTTTTRLIEEQFPNLNSRTRLVLRAKSRAGKKSLAFLVLFEEINSIKRQFKSEKTARSKKRKSESILSTEN
jgi:hypothetical protein